MSFHPNELARRGRFASIALIAGFGLLIGRFFSLQILQHAQYVLQSDKNRLSEVPVPAPRGIIYDRNGQVIAENVPGYSVSILARDSVSLRATLSRLSARVPLTPQQIAAVVRRRRQTPTRPVLVFSDAPSDLVAVLEEHRVEFPGLIIQAAPKRFYPDSSALSGFIGYTGEISEGELSSEGAAYKAGEQIGKTGIERQYEPVLRGQEGSRFVEVDARQRVVREAGVRAELPPKAPPPLRTNIDLDLQRFVAKIFGDSLQGSAVVMEPATGAVLAIHSSPGYNPNRFVGGVSASYYDSLLADKRLPLVNKAVNQYYEPGSTWKLATAIIALERGLVTLNDRMPVPCDGGYTLGDRRFRCWVRDGTGHGSLTLLRAIETSCDVYFYQLGLRVRLDTLVAGGRQLGFASRTGIDLPYERRPEFPTQPVIEYYKRHFGRTWSSPQAESMMLAMGQGSNVQTVINMARFYSALATGGWAPKPQIVKTMPERTRIFDLPQPQMDSLRDAMVNVVSARGTAGGAAIRGVALAGKTGTAQNSENPNADHAWFVGFAPAEDPKVVVAVMIEFGGHGPRAARIASSIVEHYLRSSVIAPTVTGD